MSNNHDQGPNLNERFPIKSGDQISPPSVGKPIYECARLVHVYGFVPHAHITVYANGAEVIGQISPYLGFTDVATTRELHSGDKITATQSFLGMTSVQSYHAVTVEPQPLTLGRPVVGKDIYDCGRVVPVDGLTPSTHVSVYEATVNPPPLTAAALVGEADTAGTWDPVVTSPLTAGHWVTARQVSCPKSSHQIVSPAAIAVRVKNEPSPMLAPQLDPPVVGNDVATMRKLYVGADVAVSDETTHSTVGGGLATGDANYTHVAPVVQAGHKYAAFQKLCTRSPKSPPVPSTSILAAPVLLSPICADAQFVTIRNTVINAVVVLLRNGAIIGIGGAVPGDLLLAVGGGGHFNLNDKVSVVQYTGPTISAVSNTVWVGDCANVVTQHNDNNRSGAYLAETKLTPLTVNPSKFGRIYERQVEGDIYAQPLYVRKVQTRRGLKNLVFVATSTNQVYAFDADDLSTDPHAGVVWSSAPLDPWRPLTGADICSETIGTVGITSTPVIDVRAKTIYVVTRRSTTRGDVNDGINYLHALDIRDGSERPHSPVKIEAIAPGHKEIRFDARCQRNRPGLLLLNGVVYLAYGTFNCDGNCPDGNLYRGWVMGYRTSDLKQVAVFCTSPDGGGAGVWQSGNGLVGSDDGTIFFETGNDTAPARLGDSFVRLQVIGLLPGLLLAGSFTPSNAPVLRGGDTDLGSGGPMLLPGGRLIGGGKQGRFYVLDQWTMNITQDNVPDPAIGEGFQAFLNTWNPGISLAQYAQGELYGPNIHGGPIYWEANGYVYHMPEKDYLKAFKYDPGTRNVHESPVLTAAVRPPDGMPGGFSSLSANGDHDGLVWTMYPLANGQWTKVDGTLVAFDATTLKELWRDTIPAPFAKFCPPTIADGRVYRATFASDVARGVPGKLIVYGLQHAGKGGGHGRPRAGARLRPKSAGASPIDLKHREHSGESGLLGSPASDEIEIGDDANGRCRHFRGILRGTYGTGVSVQVAVEGDPATCHHPRPEAGIPVDSSIYWTERTGAHVVQGDIRQRWMQMGAQASDLGYPISDEYPSEDGSGRLSRFEHGEIVWGPRTGLIVRIEKPAGGK